MRDELKVIATAKPDQNRAALDPWTAVHFAAGLAAGLVDVPLSASLAAATAYEVVEQVVERQEAGQEFFETHGPEHPVNALVDLAVFALGHWMGTRWNRSG